MYRILYRFLASLARLTVRSGRSKDLEIIVLRHQLAVLRRQIDRPELTDADRSLLGAIAAALARPSRAGWLVTPDTLLRQQRRRIVGHWTQPHRPPGRPSTSAELRRLALRLAVENPTWGYRLAASTVWQTIDTVTLRRFYLLFFIDIATRTVYFAPITDHPSSVWTTQAARNLFLHHADGLAGTRALVRDRGSQFTRAFDEIFRTEGCEVLKTPVRTPVANAFATLDRHPSTRAPRPHHHLEPTATRKARRRLHRSLQHAPALPFTRPATTRRHQPTR